MILDYFLTEFQKCKDSEAIFWRNRYFSYDFLLNEYHKCKNWLKKNKIQKGAVVVIEADFSPKAIALMLAMIEMKCIIVPITKSVKNKKKDFIQISESEKVISIDDNDHLTLTGTSINANNEIYRHLRTTDSPGLVLFSSGSTGKSKASVHDFLPLLNKYKVKRKTLRTITFLLYDHIGGINTLFYVLSNCGLIVTIEKRDPRSVLNTIDKCKVELLPTSPTFINLMLISEAYKDYDLNSLRLITYGTEPMPEITLKKFNKIFPKIKLRQTYGLSEVGILSSKSEKSNSLWVKIGGDGFQTRIVNDMLEIKASSAMLGYLNAESPYTKDGWFKTGDLVEVKGEYIKILGRKSEIINVGGEKVYPQEVENIIMEVENIAEATVFSEKNIILGNYVCAKVSLLDMKRDLELEKKKIKAHCLSMLERYKVPIKINISQEKQFGGRFKKKRSIIS